MTTILCPPVSACIARLPVCKAGQERLCNSTQILNFSVCKPQIDSSQLCRSFSPLPCPTQLCVRCPQPSSEFHSVIAKRSQPITVKMATKTIVLSMYRDMLRSAGGFKVRRVPDVLLPLSTCCTREHRRITTFADMPSEGSVRNFERMLPQMLERCLLCWRQ